MTPRLSKPGTACQTKSCSPRWSGPRCSHERRPRRRSPRRSAKSAGDQLGTNRRSAGHDPPIGMGTVLRRGIKTWPGQPTGHAGAAARNVHTAWDPDQASLTTVWGAGFFLDFHRLLPGPDTVKAKRITPPYMRSTMPTETFNADINWFKVTMNSTPTSVPTYRARRRGAHLRRGRSSPT